MNETAKARQLGILIFDGVEVLDFCGPFEVFSVANRWQTEEAFRIQLIAEESKPILAANGLSVNPDRVTEQIDRLDLLLVPGGMGTRRELSNENLIRWIASIAGTCELVLSVCTGSLLLARAGLLDGKRATTHHGAFELLRDVGPNATICEQARFTDDDQVITSAGISAGIDMSFHVVQKLLGWNAAVKSARQMEYDWRPFVINEESPTSDDAKKLFLQLSDELASIYEHVDGRRGALDSDEPVPDQRFVVGRFGDEAVACGCLRPIDGEAAEVKRMFVAPTHRWHGLGSQILMELERLARVLGFRSLKLEADDRLTGTLRLYQKHGFVPINPDGIDTDRARSRCFEKDLTY